MQINVDISIAKQAAQVLRTELVGDGSALGHSRSLEIVARQLGFRDWNTASARLQAASPSIGAPIPVLRVQDEHVARKFYLDYLGFTVDWEHRFEPGMPLYARLSRASLTIDISEHHGDGTPGSVIWIPVRDIRSLHQELLRNPHARLRPGIDQDAPGGPTMDITDPFSNVLRFSQASQ